jgi:predicted RNA binding protein YcfA (HicA-like mRNA interferase family)
MANLPRPSGKDMLRFLGKQGFQVIRIVGAHHFMARGSQHTTVSVHGNKTLKIGTLRGILRDVGMSAPEFEELWNAQPLLAGREKALCPYDLCGCFW